MKLLQTKQLRQISPDLVPSGAQTWSEMKVRFLARSVSSQRRSQQACAIRARVVREVTAEERPSVPAHGGPAPVPAGIRQRGPGGPFRGPSPHSLTHNKDVTN